jgi:chromosome segregation ATPase
MAWGKRAQEVVQKVYDAAVAQSAKAAKSGITKPRAKVVAKVSPAVGILPAKDLASLVSKLLGETKIGAKVQDGSLNLLPSDVKVVTAKYKDLDKNFAEVSKGGNELDGLLSGIRNEANEIGDLLLKSGMLEEIKKVTARPDPVEVKNLWDKNQETLKKLQSTLNQLDTQLGRIDKNIKNESSGFTSCIDAIGQLNITLKKGNEKSKRLSIQSLDVERNLKETKKDLETIGQAVRAGRSASVNFKSKDLAGFLKQLNTLTDTLNSVDNIEEKVKEVGPTISKLGIELEEIKKIER